MGHFRKYLRVTSLLFLLLSICSGCIPVAYVCPDVDFFSANLNDLDQAIVGKSDPDDAPAVHIVEQEVKMGSSSPVPHFSKAQRIRLLKTDAKAVRHLSCGMETRCELVCATTFGGRRTYDSQLKMYRRGYRTLTILPWKPLEHADWQPARTLQEQEIAVDLLADYQTETGFPVPSRDLAEDEVAPGQEWNSITTEVDTATSLLLAEEYEWLAVAAWRMLTSDTAQASGSEELATIYRRLRQKSRYWRERDANSPIIASWARSDREGDADRR